MKYFAAGSRERPIKNYDMKEYFAIGYYSIYSQKNHREQ